MIPELNVDQAKAEEEFVDFLFNPEEREMKLIGPGGTGKSYLVSKLITRSLEMYKQNCKLIGIEPEFDQYKLTAMTNKAAQELADATGMDVVTAHSFLNLTIKPNFTTGKQDLKRTANWTIHEGFIIFVDEAFMMDSDLLDELRSATMRCKIVFVGDNCQLDPVEAAASPIELLKVRTVELTINERQSKNPDGTPAPPYLKDLADLFRENVKNQVAAAKFNTTAPWPDIQLVPGYIDHVDDAGLEALLNGQFKVPNGRNLIMGYTNSRVNDYNNYLRGVRGQSVLFEAGEVLISNDTYERNRFRIKNEQTIQLESVDPTVAYLRICGMDVPAQYVRIVGHPDQNIPVIVDRDFHKEAIKYASKQAKSKQTNWEPYFQLKNDFADFRPRDACTVHKAQGSSKDTVIIDLTNIGACNFNVQTARMLYVALSRARYRIILYGNLPEKYGKIIR